MRAAPSRPGIWGALQAEAAARPAPEGDGRLWDRLADMVDITRFRPKLADWVELKEFHLKWGNDYAMIANTRDLVHYRLEPGEAETVKLMDGTRSVKDLVVERFQESGDLELQGVADLVYSLFIGNFLDRPYFDIDEALKRAADPLAQRRQRRREAARTLTVEWHNVDRPVRWLYDHGLKYLLNRWVAIVGLAVTFTGVGLFIEVVGSHRFSLSGQSLAIGFLVLMALNYFTVFVHEMGHALVVVHYGRRLPTAGFQIYFGSPAFFVESSDALMLERKQRMLQAFGGPFAEAMVGGIASILVFAFPGSPLAPTLYKYATLNWLLVFLNLIPLLELDGYYILADAIQVPNLRPLSMSFIQRDLWHKLRIRERFSRREVGLATYGIVGVVFTVFSFYTAYFFWKQVFGGLVSRMWHGGTVPRVLLLLLAVLVATPLIRGAISFLRAIGRRLEAVRRKIQFRLESKWRVEAASLIDKLPMFDDLPEDALSDLAGRVRLKTFRQGQVVVRQGEAAAAFYVVRSGSLEVVEEDPETSSERRLREIGRGESFGELGLVEGAPRTATVRAAGDAELYEVDKGTFDRLLADMIHVPEFAPSLQEAAELKRIPAFSHLEADEVAELLEHGGWVNLAPGEVIIEQGATGDAFYAIRSGQVDVEEDGEVVNALGPGDSFGEIALLLDVPRTATVRAKTSVRAYRVDRQGFDRLVADAFRKGSLNPSAVQGWVQRH